MKYWLILLFLNQPPTQFGPFDDLLACEKAASMVRAHRAGMGYKPRDSDGVCVSTKNHAFKYKEPTK